MLEQPSASVREVTASDCQSPADFATQSFTIEHIVPVSRGGTSTMGNLAYACPGCNGHKYNKTEAPDPVDKKNDSPVQPIPLAYVQEVCGWPGSIMLRKCFGSMRG